MHNDHLVFALPALCLPIVNKMVYHQVVLSIIISEGFTYFIILFNILGNWNYLQNCTHCYNTTDTTKTVVTCIYQTGTQLIVTSHANMADWNRGIVFDTYSLVNIQLLDVSSSTVLMLQLYGRIINQ